MFPKELVATLPDIITSWQVIAVTVVLVIFMYLISYVARTYHQPRMSKTKPKKVKAAPAPKPVAKPKSDDDDEIEDEDA